MINKSYKKKGIIVFSLIAFGLINYLFSETNIDKKYLEKLDKYELAYNEIKIELATLKQFDEPNYRSSEGLIVDFRLNHINVVNLKTPVLNDLFKYDLIKEVIFTKNGGILFKLKTCYFEDCKDHSRGFSGPYEHYLTKDNVEFINEKWVKIVEKKK